MKSNETCDYCFRQFEEDKFHPGTCGNCGAPLKQLDDIQLLFKIKKELEDNGLIPVEKSRTSMPYGYFWGEPIYDRDVWSELIKSASSHTFRQYGTILGC